MKLFKRASDVHVGHIELFANESGVLFTDSAKTVKAEATDEFLSTLMNNKVYAEFTGEKCLAVAYKRDSATKITVTFAGEHVGTIGE